MLAISAIFIRPKTFKTTFRYEVLVPYVDTQESRAKSLPEDTRHTWIIEVWASDPLEAKKCAIECFRDYRLHSRSARLASGGPVPLRIVHTA